MLSNMSVAMIKHEQIKTTLYKAKELRSFVEKLVTISKKQTLSARRGLLSTILDKDAVGKLMDTLAERYKSRNGGYLRILRSGFRQGDNAPMAIIEFV
jgi:large subunit ribosomal protein L17